MSLISEKLVLKINEILKELFDANAVCDNVVYNLENVYNLVESSQLLHLHYSHLYPLWADKFQTILTIRGCRASRIGLPEHTEEYPSMTACFEAIVGANARIEKKIIESIILADEEENFYAKISLESIYQMFGGMTKQGLVWLDKAACSEDDYNAFDDRFKKTFVINDSGDFNG